MWTMVALRTFFPRPLRPMKLARLTLGISRARLGFWSAATQHEAHVCGGDVGCGVVRVFCELWVGCGLFVCAGGLRVVVLCVCCVSSVGCAVCVRGGGGVLCGVCGLCVLCASCIVSALMCVLSAYVVGVVGRGW